MGRTDTCDARTPSSPHGQPPRRTTWTPGMYLMSAAVSADSWYCQRRNEPLALRRAGFHQLTAAAAGVGPRARSWSSSCSRMPARSAPSGAWRGLHMLRTRGAQRAAEREQTQKRREGHSGCRLLWGSRLK